MALSHLLQAKRTFHFRRIGFTEPRRWCSSISMEGESEKSSQWKKKGAAREQKEKAVESYVNKYMKTYPGVFPKPTYVHNEVGGSWYSLKSILQNVKEKIMGSPQFQNPNPTVDSKASSSCPTNSPDKIEVGGDKGTVSDIVRDTSSKNTMDSPASEATREKGYLDNVELDKPEKLVQSSQTTVDSFGEKDLSTGAEPKIVGKIFLEEIVRKKKNSDSSKLVEFKNGQREPEEPRGTQLNLDRDLKSKSALLSCLFTQVDKTSQNSFADKLHSFGYGKQAECKITSSSSKTNVGPEMGETPSSFDGNHKVIGLADHFMKRMNDQLAKKLAVKLENQHQQNGETQKSNHEQLYSMGHFTASQNTATLQEFAESKPTSSGYENQSENHLATYSDGSQKIVGLADSFTKMVHNEEGQVFETNNEMLPPNNSLEYPKETRGEAEAEANLKCLLDCIKELPRDQHLVRPEVNIISNQTNRSTNVDPITGVQSQAKTDDEEGGGAIFTAFRKNLKARGPLQMIEKELKKDQNKVIVRFLPETAEESDVIKAFKGCGDIGRIEFFHGTLSPSPYKFASVYFKTVEGMKKALESRDTFVKSTSVTVESPSSSTMDNTSNMLPIPNLIGNPDAPAALLKNPTRTVMIRPFTQDICSYHIEEAFAFCESKISGLFLGSSRTVAYVEFKTEDSKERALEKRSIVVLGKQLSIIRIDLPRTTVLRVSNIDFPSPLKKLNSIFESLGKVRSIKVKHKGMIEVHFKLEEWPNMLKILNTLNGMEVEGCQLVAEPAPVFPNEILRALWSQPDERRHVKAVVRGLLRKLGESSINKVALADIAAKFYGYEC